MQPPVQYNGLYTFIDILGACDGAGAGQFHHYMPLLCTTADAHHMMGGVKNSHFAHQSWEVDCEL